MSSDYRRFTRALRSQDLTRTLQRRHIDGSTKAVALSLRPAWNIDL